MENDERRQKAAELYEQGLPIKEIAEQLQVSRQAVTEVLKRQGVLRGSKPEEPLP